MWLKSTPKLRFQSRMAACVSPLRNVMWNYQYLHEVPIAVCNWPVTKIAIEINYYVHKATAPHFINDNKCQVTVIIHVTNNYINTDIITLKVNYTVNVKAKVKIWNKLITNLNMPYMTLLTILFVTYTIGPHNSFDIRVYTSMV